MTPDPEQSSGPGAQPAHESLRDTGNQASQYGALIPQVQPGPALGDSWDSMMAPGAQPGPNTQKAFMHALRRRWLLAGFVGAICAAGAVAAAWALIKPTYTATAVLRVATQQESLIFDIEGQSQSSFNVYKNTQQQLVESDFVLIAALRDPEVGKLAVVKEEPDPVRYLAKELRVDFPGESELMTVRLTGDDPDEVTVLVNAVVDSYLAEVVDMEKSRRQQRLKELDDLYDTKAGEVRTKRVQLKSLADQFGTSDSNALALQQQIALEQFATFRRETVRAQFETRKIQGELNVQQAMLDRLDELKEQGKDGPEDAVIEAAARVDPVSVELFTRRAQLEAVIHEYERRAANGRVPAEIEQLRTEVDRIDEQLVERKALLEVELRQKRRRDVESRIAELTSQLAIAQEQERQLKTDLDNARITAEQFGGSSIDVEIMRSEIARLENDVLNPVAEERERLRVELETPSRVTLFQAALRPRAPDDSSYWAKLIMAAILGLGLPIAGILYLDTRKQRVNCPKDVIETLGITVLGTMPPFRPETRRLGLGRLRPGGRRQQRVREAANGIIARILHETEHADSRVVLVTSATSGEGKTTLSMQLATALAHIGYRTVLVDFDLRRPSLARLFNAPAGPGVSELLRGEVKLEETYHETDIDGLTLLPAGAWISRSFAVLANGATRMFFDELRRQYDFVVVDGSPVLPVAESRLIARHADRVVLSVLRDVSRSPQVATARETLTAFGAQSVEAVVTGFYEDVYYEQIDPPLELEAAPASEMSEVEVG